MPWYAIALVCVGGFFLLLFAMSLWEKHAIRSYRDPAEVSGSYALARVQDAEDLGFPERADYRHDRFDLERLN